MSVKQQLDCSIDVYVGESWRYHEYELVCVYY
jgi:hypothetical protein